MSTEENSFRYIKETGEIQRNHSFELNWTKNKDTFKKEGVFYMY